MKRCYLIGLIIAVSLLFILTVSPAQAAPSFKAAGTAVDGTGAVTPQWPAHAAGDIALLFVESRSEDAVTLSTPAGFVQVANSPQATIATGANGTRLTVFWVQATSASMGNPTVAATADHLVAQIITYQGVLNTGNPWDITGGGIDDTSSTSVTATGVTTTVVDTLIVVAVAQGRDANSTTTFTNPGSLGGWTNVNLTGIAERSDYASNRGNGGGFGVMDGVKAAIGLTGNTTVTMSNAFRKAFLTIALKPQPSLIPFQLAFSVQPSDTTAGATITPAVQVQIQDAFGTLVTTATNAVTIAIGTNPASGTLSGTLSVNAVNGVATFNDLSIDKWANGYTLTATSGILLSATSSTFNIRGPSKLAFSVQPSKTIYNAIISPAVTVQIQDSLGNLVPIATNTVTIAIGTNPASGTLSGTLSVSAVAGVATFSNLSINNAGNGYTLTANVAGLTSATSNAFNITTGAYDLTQCAGSRYGSNLGCTANDVQITNISVVGGLASCEGGSVITVDLAITVNSGSPNRYDVGIFISNDGTDPQLTSAASCSVGILPTNDPPFRNLDPGPWNGTLDTCGDVNGTMNGGTGSGTFTMTNVNVLCQSLTGSGGNLYIPFVVSWDQQSSPSGGLCTSAANPVPGTVSKCNAPLVAQGTVGVVVLPTITKTDNKTTIAPGEITNYTVVITNTTGVTLTNAVFKDPAVTGLTANSVTCSGAACPCASCSVAAMQGAGITIPSLTNNSSVTFTINATVSSTPPATFTNTATVTVADPAATPVADRTVSASDTVGGSGSGSGGSRVRVIKWREVFQ